MPFVELKNSPHAAGVSPVSIHYRDVGSGPPLVFLHGGWGYGVYPIDRQIEELSSRVRFLIPDRSGHARSTPFAGPLPLDFHRRAAEETLLVLDSLGIERAFFWGHSDGAVIAAMIGLRAPERCQRLLLEAFHFYRRKPASHQVFFQCFADHPEEVGGKLRTLLAADHGERNDHGEQNWQHVVKRNCRVWLDLAAAAASNQDPPNKNPPNQDLYDGHLGELRVPVTFMHGRGDPRTEPGELEQAFAALPRAQMRYIETGRHSPHSEEVPSQECTKILTSLM